MPCLGRKAFCRINEKTLSSLETIFDPKQIKSGQVDEWNLRFKILCHRSLAMFAFSYVNFDILVCEMWIYFCSLHFKNLLSVIYCRSTSGEKNITFSSLLLSRPFHAYLHATFVDNSCEFSNILLSQLATASYSEFLLLVQTTSSVRREDGKANETFR